MAEAIASGRNAAVAALYSELVVKPYREHQPMQWFRMGDELMAAYLIDPSVVTETKRFYVDVDTQPGMDYGGSMFWDELRVATTARAGRRALSPASRKRFRRRMRA